MLYLVSVTEDPTDDEVLLYEAPSVKGALEQYESDYIGHRSEPELETVYVFEVKKTSKQKFTAQRGITWKKEK
jgi:hypothetical protein